MFNGSKYLTRGVETTLPSWLVNLLRFMVCGMEMEWDYLQIFRLSRTETGQHIIHEQKPPPYRYELDVPCGDAVTARVYVIDDQTHSTMLLADEY